MIFAPDLFHGKAYLVTGAGGGVGGATARLLAQLGARLAITDVNATALEATAKVTGAVPLLGDLRQVSTCTESACPFLQFTMVRFADPCENSFVVSENGTVSGVFGSASRTT